MLPPGVEGYQLIERIGKGQFGEVYRGLAPGGVVVAVKRILRSMDDDSCQRNSSAGKDPRTQSSLSAPDAQLLRPGGSARHRDGTGGWKPRHRMKECKAAGKPGIPVDELLSYFREAAEGLDYLREQKLAHRDIKPENLLRLKGHARSPILASPAIKNSVDHTMHVAGTAAYMPPEMWRRDQPAQRPVQPRRHLVRMRTACALSRERRSWKLPSSISVNRPIWPQCPKPSKRCCSVPWRRNRSMLSQLQGVRRGSGRRSRAAAT